MQFITRVLAVCCLALVAACATVTVDHDRHAEFRAYESFAFLPETEQQGYTSLDALRIERALMRELAARDMRLVEPDDADILVRYDIVEEIRQQSSGISTGFGLARNNVGLIFTTPPDTRQIKEGKLVVEFITPDDRRAIWRASSQRNLTESMRPDRRERLIDSLVADMLERFPPG